MKQAATLILLAMTMFPSSFAAPANLSIYSQDRQHRLDFWNIERGSPWRLPTDSAPYTNTVLSIITDQKSGAEMKRRFEVAYPEMLTSEHVMLSENARAILVMPGPLAAARCDLHLLFDTNNAATAIDRYTQTVEAPSYQLLLSSPRSVIDRLTLTESILPFFDRHSNQPIIRIWEAALDQWIAFNFRGEKITIPPELAAEWNSKTLGFVRARIHARESVETRNKLGRFKSTLESVLQTNSVPDIQDVEYEFVAARRQNSDRALLAALNHKDEKWQPTPIFFEQRHSIKGAPNFYAHRNYQRIRADHFLAIWDQKIPSSHLSSSQTNFHSIGRVRGRIQLPIPLIPIGKNQHRKIYIHLIPEPRGRTRWPGSPDVDTLSTYTSVAPVFLSDFPDTFEFSFPTTLPGSYFLKIIWDCRPPFSSETAASPGDYETDFIPFTLKPAGEIQLVVHCTNRIAGGETYYQADAVVLKQWKTGNLPVESDLSFANRPHFSRPLQNWLLQTNLLPVDIPIKRLTVLFTPGKTNPPNLILSGYTGGADDATAISSLKFTIEFPDKTTIRSLSHFGDPISVGSFLDTFQRFPTNYPTFRLRAYSRTINATPILDLALTNLLY